MKIDALCKQMVKLKMALNRMLMVLGSPSSRARVNSAEMNKLGNVCRPLSMRIPTEIPEIMDR